MSFGQPVPNVVPSFGGGGFGSASFGGTNNAVAGSFNLPKPLDCIRKLWDSDATVVEQSLATIAAMCDGGLNAGNAAAQNRFEIVRLGGPMLIVETLKQKFPAAASLHAEGCAALANLAGTREHANLIREVDGEAAVLFTMDKFPGDANLQLKGCRALIGITRHEFGSAECFLQSGCIAKIVDTMAANLPDATFQELACTFLAEKAGLGDAVKAAIVQAGGLSAMSKAAEVHFSVPGVANAVVRAVSIILTKHGTNQSLVMGGGIMGGVYGA